MAKKDKTADQVAQGETTAPTPAPLPPAPVPSETEATPVSEAKDLTEEDRKALEDARQPVGNYAEAIADEQTKNYSNPEGLGSVHEAMTARADRSAIVSKGERMYTEAEVYRAMRYAVSGERGKRKMDDWSKQVGGAAMTYEQRFAEITHADFENGLVYEGDGKPWSPR